MCSHQSSTRSSTECSSKSLWVSADGFPCSFKSFSRSRCARSASTTRSVQSCSISHLQRQSSVDPRIPYIFHLQHLVEHILSPSFHCFPLVDYLDMLFFVLSPSRHRVSVLPHVRRQNLSLSQLSFLVINCFQTLSYSSTRCVCLMCNFCFFFGERQISTVSGNQGRQQRQHSSALGLLSLQTVALKCGPQHGELRNERYCGRWRSQVHRTCPSRSTSAENNEERHGRSSIPYRVLSLWWSNFCVDGSNVSVPSSHAQKSIETWSRYW